MGGWAGWMMENLFVLRSSNDVAVDLRWLSSSGQSPHTGAHCQVKSYPDFIFPKVQPVFS